MLNAVPRLDVGTIKNYQKTPEGFLSVYMTVSKVGELLYQRLDGTTESEHLSEQELFDEKSLATLAGKPITLGHPRELVSANNVRKYIRGSVSHKVIKDSPYLTVLAVVHDQEAIDAIESGKAQQVSAGYTAKITRGDDGKLYQSNREYNHISLVPVGRAGNQVKVHIDSLDASQTEGIAVQVSRFDELAQLRVREDLARDGMIARMSGRSVTANVGHTQTKGQHMVITFRMSDAAAIALTNAAREQKTSPERLVLDLVEEKYGSSEKPEPGEKHDAAETAYAAYVERLRAKSGRR